jgi:LacI family transcriptional regulator
MRTFSRTFTGTFRSHSPSNEMAHKISKRITIVDVARAAGVSFQTVSRVINSKPDVSSETRERIEQVIQELGYKPSVIARSLIQQRSYTIGVVTAGLKFIGPSLTLNGITQQAEEKGYTLLLKELPSFTTDDVQYLVDSLLSRHVDGIIWAAPEISENRKWIEENAIHLSIPIIFLSMHPIEGISTLDVDNYLGGQMATQHLLDCGYQHVGLISGPLDWWSARQRKLGWEDILVKNHREVTPRSWIEGNWSCSSGEKAFEQLLTQYPEIDAVFSANDQMALGAMSYAYLHDIRIPGNIAFVGFDDIAEARYFCPPLTTVKQDLLSLGYKAVNEIVRAIEKMQAGKSWKSNNHLLAPQLVIRQSTVST